ncbi:unnamed protein product [Paramecium sonneborni]|uniref:Uncharacterized protein n=1 Tax=Paramecium sonneborni TaxID=65129 RepID=A0A8S1REF6_9CILI|nr:unnamed protein product [Paramecium sonneborni]
MILKNQFDRQYIYHNYWEMLLEQNPEKFLKQNFNCLNYHCNKPILIKDHRGSISEQKILDRYSDITFKKLFEGWFRQFRYINIILEPVLIENANLMVFYHLVDIKNFDKYEQCHYKWYDEICFSFNKICILFLKNVKNGFFCFFQEFIIPIPNYDMQSCVLLYLQRLIQ